MMDQAEKLKPITSLKLSFPDKGEPGQAPITGTVGYWKDASQQTLRELHQAIIAVAEEQGVHLMGDLEMPSAKIEVSYVSELPPGRILVDLAGNLLAKLVTTIKRSKSEMPENLEDAAVTCWKEAEAEAWAQHVERLNGLDWEVPERDVMGLAQG